MRSRIEGRARTVRLLRAIPDAMRQQLLAAMDQGGRTIKAEMVRRAPRRTGALARAIDYKVFPATLRLRVGLLSRFRARASGRGASGPFYGRILDLGRKAQVVTVHRLSASDRAEWMRRRRNGGRRNVKPADLGVTYKLRVKPLAGREFITGAVPNIRATMNRLLNGIWNRALGTIAKGGDDE